MIKLEEGSLVKISIHKISKIGSSYKLKGKKKCQKTYFAGFLGGEVADRGTTFSSKEFAGDGLGALIPEVHSAMSM